MDRMVHGVAKSQAQLSGFHFHFLVQYDWCSHMKWKRPYEDLGPQGEATWTRAKTGVMLPQAKGCWELRSWGRVLPWRLRKEHRLPTTWSWTSHPHNSEKTHFCFKLPCLWYFVPAMLGNETNLTTVQTATERVAWGDGVGWYWAIAWLEAEKKDAWHGTGRGKRKMYVTTELVTLWMSPLWVY